MKPRITKVKKYNLLGCVFYGDPFHSAEEWSPENEIGKLWAQFMELYEKYKNELSKKRINSNFTYELHIGLEKHKKNHRYYVFVGIEVEKLGKPPVEMFNKVLPPTKYAVFTFKGKNMHTGGEYIYKKWLPNSQYHEAFPFQLLAYDDRRFKGLDHKESELDYYIPIKKSKR